MKYLIKILVNRKSSIKDPQAVTLESTLKRLEIVNESKVKIGKLFEIELTAEDKLKAKEKAQHIGKEFLSNIILESFEIVEIKEL